MASEHRTIQLLAIPIILLSGLLIFVAVELGVTINHNSECVGAVDSVCHQDWTCTNADGSTFNISATIQDANKFKKDCFSGGACGCADPDKDGDDYAKVPDLGGTSTAPDGSAIDPSTATFKDYGYCSNGQARPDAST